MGRRGTAGYDWTQRGWVASPRSHGKSGVQVWLPGPRPAALSPPSQEACVASLVSKGSPAQTWCQCPPGPGFMRQKCNVLIRGHQQLDDRQPDPCPPVLLPSQAGRPPSGQTGSKQALGHFTCPFIALNGEGLPAQALKGQRQESSWLSGKCVGVVGTPGDPLTPGWGCSPPCSHAQNAVTGQEARS